MKESRNSGPGGAKGHVRISKPMLKNIFRDSRWQNTLFFSLQQHFPYAKEFIDRLQQFFLQETQQGMRYGQLYK